MVGLRGKLTPKGRQTDMGDVTFLRTGAERWFCAPQGGAQKPGPWASFGAPHRPAPPLTHTLLGGTAQESQVVFKSLHEESVLLI